MLEFDESKVRVGDSGGLDLDESGCLTVLLNNSTVLMKREQEASEYSASDEGSKFMILSR